MYKTSFKPVTITYETLDRLSKEDKSNDLIALYMHYVAISQWQNTVTVKATTSFMMKRVGWGKQKFLAIKGRLKEMGLVEDVKKTDSKGQVTGWYVKVLYVVQNPPSGENHPVDFRTPSTNNLNKSPVNLKESARAQKLEESRELLKELIEIVNPKEKPIDSRVRILNDRLKDYEFDEIKHSAVVFSTSEWHKQNKQMSIDNLLAPSKFGRWYAQSQEAKNQPKRGFA